MARHTGAAPGATYATPVQPRTEVAAATDRFSLARQVLSLRATFAKHHDGIEPEAREAGLANGVWCRSAR